MKSKVFTTSDYSLSGYTKVTEAENCYQANDEIKNAVRAAFTVITPYQVYEYEMWINK